jgi:hypothetical protein
MDWALLRFQQVLTIEQLRLPAIADNRASRDSLQLLTIEQLQAIAHN